MTKPYCPTPIRASFLTQARDAALDDQQQPVVHLTAKGGEPCRDVLRRARPGEPLILASYCPFTQAGPYREYGPVFILQDANQLVSGDHYLPRGTPGDYLQAEKPLVLRAYNAREEIAAASLVQPDRIDAELSAYFLCADVRFVLLRFAAYGCYGLRFDRREGNI